MRTPLLGDREFYRGVMRIGLPVALQNLLGTTAGMIDTAMIGMQGELSVAAVGLAAQFGSLLFNTFIGFANGGTLFFSQFWGAKDETGIRKAYGITLLCMMAVSFVFCGLAVFCPEWIMGIYTDKEDIAHLGAQYLRIVGMSYPLQVLACAISSLLRSTENVRLPLAAAIAATVTNVLLNWLLIFGKFGLPAMGANGAAVGTVASAFVNVSVLYVACIAKKEPLLLRIREHYGWTPLFVRQYFGKCLPIILNEFGYGAGQLVINIVMGRQDAAAIAIIAVFRSLEGLVYAFFGGLANACGVIVGKKVGAGDHLPGYTDGKRFSILCPAITFSITCLMFLLRTPLLHVFGMQGQALEYGRWMLLIYIAASTARTCNYMINTTYRAGGESVFGSVLEVGGLYFVAVPAVYIMGMLVKAPFLAVFAMMYLDEIVKLLIGVPYLASGKWIKPVTAEGRATVDEFRKSLRRRKKQEVII